MSSYDIIIIGAGINGCSLAHSLHHKGQKVLVLEQEDVASGGSGAAGAFINPKISKSGPLKDLIEEAYIYAMDFYSARFPAFTTSAPLLHIAKYQDDNDKVEYFKTHTGLRTQETPDELKSVLTEYADGFSSVYLKDNAILEAKDICKAMLEEIEYQQVKVESPVYENGLWDVCGYKGKKIVLCTGAYEEIFKEAYIKLRRIYGQRCEVTSSTQMKATVHHEVSVSATKKNGRIAIGASHYLNEKDIPSSDEGAQALIDLAKKSVRLEDIKLERVYCGMRSGSNDYFPIIGPLVDSKKSLDLDSTALQGNKTASVVNYPELYMINGVGGYGFVLAPLLTDLLSRHLVDEEPLPKSLESKRFYYRWAKKEEKK